MGKFKSALNKKCHCRNKRWPWVYYRSSS